MKLIKSFTVNHNTLDRGIYISRKDGDVVTYDLRMKKPNDGNYLNISGLHTAEHLLATFVRNSNYSDSIVYVGPMGCRTGMYLLVRDNVSVTEVISLVRDAFKFMAEFTGEIPGAKKIECGNYLDHDLADCKREAAAFCSVIENWTEQMTEYPE